MANDLIQLPYFFCTRFEKYRDPIPSFQWCQARPWIPIVAVTLYAAAIYFGPKAMEVSYCLVVIKWWFMLYWNPSAFYYFASQFRVSLELFLLLIIIFEIAQKQESWNWRKTLAAWNLLLSLFSFMGMIRTVPHVLVDMATLPLRDNICVNPRYGSGSGSTGLWMFLFAMSKFP